MIAYYFALAAAINGSDSISGAGFSYMELTKPALTVAPPGKSALPVPIGDPGLWVTTNDYPAKALEEEREGIVGFNLTVAPNGRVAKCQIMSSSGSEDLDSTACMLISQRARFTPATNRKGAAVPGSYTNRVRWQIPSKGQNVAWNIPLPKPGHANVTYVVDENGKPSKCEITNSSKVEGDKTPCEAGVTFQPYYNAKGERVKVKVEVSYSFKITEEVPATSAQ